MPKFDEAQEQAVAEIRAASEALSLADQEVDMTADDHDGDDSVENYDKVVAANAAYTKALDEYNAVLAKWEVKSNDPRVADL